MAKDGGHLILNKEEYQIIKQDSNFKKFLKDLLVEQILLMEPKDGVSGVMKNSIKK